MIARRYRHKSPLRGCRDPMGDGMVGPAKLKRAGSLKVFALQEHPSVGDLVQASTGKDRCDVRNAIQGMHSILNERERHVAHRPSHAGSRQPRRENRRYWSGKRDLNPRPSPWQGDALPLSYSRSKGTEGEGRILLTRTRAVKQPAHRFKGRYFRYKHPPVLRNGNNTIFLITL